MLLLGNRRVYSGEDLLRIKDDKNRWIVPGIIPRGGRVFIYGEGSTYKSTVIFDLCVAVSSGGYLLRQFPINIYGPTLVVSTEGNIYENKERLLRHCRAHDVNLADISLHYCQEPFLLDDVTERDELRECIEQIHPAIVVLDPLDSFFVGDENSAKETKPVRRFLDAMCRGFETTFILIHHESKKGELRGSSALYGWADTVIRTKSTRSRLGKKGPEVDILTLEAKKIRNGAKGMVFSCVPFVDELMGTATFAIYNGQDTNRILSEYGLHLVYRTLRLSASALTVTELSEKTGMRTDLVNEALYTLEGMGYVTEDKTERSTGNGRSRGVAAWRTLPRQGRVDLAIQFIQTREAEIEQDLRSYTIEPQIDGVAGLDRPEELYSSGGA